MLTIRLGTARVLSSHTVMASVSKQRKKRVLKGVIFDMDGTLTEPVIDFAEMRRRCGVMSGDLLDTIASWPAEKQKAANQAIKEIEEEALLKMKLMPGLIETCNFLEDHGLTRGLVTRNVDASVHYFHTNHFNKLSPFWPALSRDFKPYKPNPDALLHICQQWGIPPEQAVMVGDSAKDDIVAGNRAGMDTILLDMQQRFTDTSQLEDELKPSHIVPSLAAIPDILQSCYCLERPSHLAKDIDAPPETRATVG